MYAKDLVSIIIPFHNGEQYVERCLSCLDKQIYKQYEAIFIDDGSTDKAVNIIKENLNSKVRLISISRSGVSTARNIGIKSARGQYITFWDIDDIPHANFISKFIEDIHKYKVDTVISNYEDVYANNERIKIELPWRNQIITQNEIKNSLIQRMIYPVKNESEIRGLVWRTFTHTELIINNKIFFDTEIRFAEDLLFTIELYNLSKKIYVEEESLYDYIRSRTSTMNAYVDDYIEQNLLLHKKLVNKLKKLNLYLIASRRYEANRLCMYSVCISGCVRDSVIRSGTLVKVKQLRKILLEDRIDIWHSLAPTKVKIACYLLRFKMYWLLIGIYMLKEKWRISKFN